MQFKIVLKVATAQQEKVKEEKGVYFLYLEFIESVTMAPRDHLSNHDARKNNHMQEPVTTYYRKPWLLEGGGTSFCILVADSQADYTGVNLSATQATPSPVHPNEGSPMRSCCGVKE